MINPLAKKFQIKEEYSVLMMNSNPDVHPLFDGVRIEYKSSSEQQFDTVILFTRNEDELIRLITKADEKTKDQGNLWVSYPKRSGSIETDLNRDSTWKALKSFGLEPVRLISVNDDWSSMRLRHESERESPSKFGQDPPGVDRVAKTVVPPEDLQKELEANPEALSFFESLAFSHKREYVGWIHEAKKEETRNRRVKQTIEMLLKGKKSR